MNILELFSGTESFSKVARDFGHSTYTVDNDPKFASDWCGDIMDFEVGDMVNQFDFVWASPPCQTFTVLRIGKNWDMTPEGPVPNCDESRAGVARVVKTLEILADLGWPPFVIENPRAMMRHVKELQSFDRHTVTYCQYGERRMKSTDLWTNIKGLELKPPCKYGAECHERSPRGSRTTGTESLRNSAERSKVPEQLCVSILVQVMGMADAS